MSEYIDADFVVVCDEWRPTVTSGEEQEYIKREDAENIMLGSCDESALWKLRYLPSADVIEVVRCKDCKYCENVIVAVTNSGEKTQRNICCRFTMAVDAKHFCSYGEK